MPFPAFRSIDNLSEQERERDRDRERQKDRQTNRERDSEGLGKSLLCLRIIMLKLEDKLFYANSSV